MICRDNFIYLQINNAKQTFAYTTNIRWLCEGLFRVYTSCGSIWYKLRKRNLLQLKIKFAY
jgi:hypothetical protein